MWSVISRMGRMLGLSPGEPQVDLDTIYSVLDTTDPPSEEEQEESMPQVGEGGSACQQRVGVVTQLFDSHGFIGSGDSEVFFSRQYCPTSIKAGDRVVYLAFRQSEDSEWVVRKILYKDNETWDRGEGDVVEGEELTPPVVMEELETAYKSVIAKVTGRRGRTVVADNLQFCLDSVQIPFIPVEGDWVVLQSLVQTQSDEPLSADTVLSVSRVSPVRERQAEGKVTCWTPDTRQGIISNEVVFTKDACEPGYIPGVGDQVAFYCIESEQGPLTWRAVHVVPTATRAIDTSHDSQGTLALLSNKHSIVISEDTNCGVLNVGQQADVTIQVKNVGTEMQRLEAVEFQANQQSQFQLSDPPSFEPKDILPAQNLHFVFNVNARFVGCTTDLVVFRFSSFSIGRHLAVDVQTPELAACLADRRNRPGTHRTKQPPQPITPQKILATRNGFIVPGVRPIKPANFVPVKLGMFQLPEKLKNLVISAQQNKRREDVIRQMVEQYPFLEEPLTPSNFKLRWDTLIYLEEIENRLNIMRYNTQDSLHHVQDYLSLSIPGLAERRPSLIVGDKVIAQEAWTDKNYAQVDGYEGFIHKVKSDEILIKFNPAFHDMCSGLYDITFEVSRTQYRREHQAVHVAINNLTADWLFPSTVGSKPPQIVITDEEDYIQETNRSMPLQCKKEDTLGNNANTDAIALINVDEHITSDATQQDNMIKDENCPLRITDRNLVNNFNNKDGILGKVQSKIDLSDCEVSLQEEKRLMDITEKEKQEGDRLKEMDVEQRRRKTSEGFEQSTMKDVSQPKASSPRVPVVDRFLQNGNCHDSEKGSKEVKNNLFKLANLSKNGQEFSENQSMKTLEQVERQLLKTNCNSLGSEQLFENRDLLLDEEASSPFRKFLIKNNITDKIKTVEVSRKEVTTRNIESGTDSNKVIDSGTNMPNQLRNENRIKWNSNNEMKMGIEKEAFCKIPLRMRRKLKWFNPLLNHYQKETVRNILKGEARPLPYVIFGPPGTGKTITLVETILQIYFLIPESRMLISTPSNSSADLVAERLVDCGLMRPGDLLRLVGHQYAEQGRMSDNLRPYCGTADIKARDDDDPQTSKDEGVVNLSRHAIGRHRVTVGTCSTLGVLHQMGFPRGHFTHVLVDEAGQAKEPETLIPIVFLSKTHGQVVLAGDPLQLGPVVLSQMANQCGLGQSLLARLLDRLPYRRDPIGYPSTGGYNPLLVTRLRHNYRSLPGVLDLPNMLFYDGDLIPQVCESGSKEALVLAGLAPLFPAGPIVFHGVRGTNWRAPESPSWYNPPEVVQTAIYLQELYKAGLTPDQCGIITPYQAQVLKMRHMLQSLEMELPKIGSVEEFQGQERLVIILSTVRSSPHLMETDVRHMVGFVASPQRLNVAITRARAGLIIVGNPHLLVRDQYWRPVLEYCVVRGAYTGCNLPSLNLNIDTTNPVEVLNYHKSKMTEVLNY